MMNTSIGRIAKTNLTGKFPISFSTAVIRLNRKYNVVNDVSLYTTGGI